MGRTKTSDRASPKNEQEKLDEVIELLTHFRWTLGYFLLLLFGNFGKQYSQRRTPRHAAYVSNYLGGRDAKKAGENRDDGVDPKATSLASILSLIYDHTDGTPGHASTSRDLEYLARPQVSVWCQSVVTLEITREAEKLTKRESGLHLPRGSQEWQTLSSFSMDTFASLVTTDAPVLYALLATVATSTTTGTQAPREAHSDKARDPRLVSIMAILMLLICRNRQVNLFQKLLGVWLFACSAPVHVFRVLCRLGMCVSYGTVIEIYKQLSKDSIKVTRSLAAQMRFLVIFDNINRTRRFWRPSLGQLDALMSGTAATLVELLERTASGAFNLLPVFEARKQQRRLSLTPGELYDRIDQEHLSSVMALHCVSFLVSNCASLLHLSSYTTDQFRTTFAIRRMPDNTKTKVHPLSSSSINENSSAGCRDVLKDILLEQLKLPPDVVNSILVIIGGDLGTIEKIRSLQTLEASCPHGFPSFSWVLPLVQLWHMGWADLARIINTYWGKPASSDPSSLWYNCKLLGRKVKPETRPDYYPALALITDTLEADVLDCWRLLLKTHDLDAYFSSLDAVPTGPELFAQAETLVSRWASTHAHDIAMLTDEYWEGPTASLPTHDDKDSDSDEPLQHKQDKRRSKSDSASKNTKTKKARKKRKTEVSPEQLEGFQGDHCLANSIVRMRDSLWHYEFVYAIADGDIGRAMKVMSAWLFTFTGSGASKYANELLELSAGFLYEFPPALQEALMDNWLCNLSGLPGCWFAMDLMQEHSIRELKEKSQRRDEDFEGAFFQDVISRNVRHFVEIKTIINTSVGLQNRGAAHGSTKDPGTATRLRNALEAGRVHYYVAGRSHSWRAQDDFMAGFEKMPSKVQRFLRDTPLVLGDAHASSVGDMHTEQPLNQDTDIAESDSEDQPDKLGERGVPAPVMVVDGRVVVESSEDHESDEDTSD